MAGMYGADIVQLRALAAHFDRAADQLDTHRTGVGVAIRTSAWQGPDAGTFRYQWDSAHAVRVSAAAEALRVNAQRLRANADDQERTSAVDGSGGVPPLVWPGISDGGLIGGSSQNPGPSWWDRITGVWDTYDVMTDAALLSALGVGVGFVAANVRGTRNVQSLLLAMQFSSAYQTASALDGVVNMGPASRVLGWVGVGFNAVDLAQEIAEGDVGGAIWAGVKTGLGVGALLAPFPVNVGLGAVGAVIGVTEFAVENWDTITDVAQSTWDATTSVVNAGLDMAGDAVSGAVDMVGDAVAAGADMAGDVVNGFAEGVGAVADALWPW